MTAAFVAAGLGIIPGTAQAADPVPVAAGVAEAIAEASTSEGFHSPADRTIRTTLPAAAKGKAGVGAKSAAPQTAGAAAAEQAALDAGANPTLAVDVSGTSYTAHGIELTTLITSADFALDVAIDWGDGKTDTVTAQGNAELHHSHTYDKSGEYQVKVTVTDTANAVQATNGGAFLTPGADFTPHAPARLLDTRNGTGSPVGKVAGQGSARVKVAGNASVPAGVTAVALNVTVTETVDSGHVTAWPGAGYERPITSNLNYTAGHSVPNLVIVPVGEDGYVELFNGGWSSVDLIADVTGYFTRASDSGYTSMTPARFVDTREGTGTSKGMLASRSAFTTRIGGLQGVPENITAVALNVTVTEPQGPGHLTAFSGTGPVPTASNLNFVPGQTVANAVIVPVAADGTIKIFNGAWSPTHVVVDVVGYYSKESKAAFLPFTPFRTLDTREEAYGWPGGRFRAREYITQGFTPDSETPTGVEAYVLNATVTETGGTGFLSVAPSPYALPAEGGPAAPAAARPGSSTLNWTAGTTVPNLVQASDGDHGVIDFWNQGHEDADLVLDVFGVYQTK
ncbi:PKD domain-containing protein [Streptomyces erythrochromogenes]|uniref:PKD domain-containing protein n=1 Tax=Streptomyces erythrochromogenes TaxID=285574 RepID=UPI00224E7FC6|nr:PKD domain-containing protein [Streptomyces erythrochromogenes]MCX5588875.1 PKD domain-containing protein [Streptomyces erythrochromogenes]